MIDILFLSLYGCLVCALVVLKIFKMGSRRRGLIKMLISLFFVTAGIVGCVRNGGGLSVMLVVGLFFAALGDFFLVFMDDHSNLFVFGVGSFLLASLMLSVYSGIHFGISMPNGWYWWAVGIWAVLVTLNVLGQTVFKVINFGKYKIVLNLYMVFVSACGSIGLVLLCYATSLSTILFGLGCFMYFLSDLFLGVYMLKCHKTVLDAINSVLYFPGMLLVALSLIFI